MLNKAKPIADRLQKALEEMNMFRCEKSSGATIHKTNNLLTRLFGYVKDPALFGVERSEKLLEEIHSHIHGGFSKSAGGIVNGHYWDNLSHIAEVAERQISAIEEAKRLAMLRNCASFVHKKKEVAAKAEPLRQRIRQMIKVPIEDVWEAME